MCLIAGCAERPTPSSQQPTQPLTAQDLANEAVSLKAQGALVIPTQDTLGSLNVHSSKFGIVYRTQEGCYVDVETTSLNVPPASAPEAIQALECTPFMNDPIWQRCLSKEIYRTDKDRCVCKMPGAAAEEGTEIPCPPL